VHSLDRPKIAQRLNAARPDHLPPINICIQINICNEANKSGVTPEQLPALITACAGLPKLRLRGLMTLPEPCADPERQRVPFRRLKLLFDELNCAYPWFDTLSMGTSQDMQSAIAEGATIVRIGTRLFGPRA
jgi:pyridoxal phosphate enzyme, YggS family